MTINRSVPAYGFSLNNEERREHCCGGGFGGGKRDVPGDARQVTGEAGTRGVFDFRSRPRG